MRVADSKSAKLLGNITVQPQLRNVNGGVSLLTGQVASVVVISVVSSRGREWVRWGCGVEA